MLIEATERNIPEQIANNATQRSVLQKRMISRSNLAQQTRLRKELYKEAKKIVKTSPIDLEAIDVFRPMVQSVRREC
jgi:hypothetical protein